MFFFCYYVTDKCQTKSYTAFETGRQFIIDSQEKNYKCMYTIALLYVKIRIPYICNNIHIYKYIRNKVEEGVLLLEYEAIIKEFPHFIIRELNILKKKLNQLSSTIK